MSQVKVLSVNTSEKKGTLKKPVDSIVLNERGVLGDAHSGKWHRQVSLLAKESIDKFSIDAGREIKYGEFAENITTEGILLNQLNPLDILKNGSIELMVTQIGKKCHGDNCNIFREVGNCVMPKEGIFAKVLKNGKLKEDDVLELLPKVISCQIIVLSDRASSGEYNDKSGELLKQGMVEYFSSMKYPHQVFVTIIPDDPNLLKALVVESIEKKTDVIITSGGTGIGPRDITPEVVNPLIEKVIPGIMDAIRQKYGSEIPNALISRSIAGTTKESLIYTLPGSPKAVKEYMVEIQKSMYHLMLMLNGLGH